MEKGDLVTDGLWSPTREQNASIGDGKDKDSHAPTKERVGRGATRCLRDKRREQNQEYIFEVDKVSGCIVGNDNQHIITKNGCLVREFAKFDGTTWKHQPQTIKDLIAKKCTEKSNHAGNLSVRKAIIKQAGNAHKNKQYKLHLHYKKFPSKEEAEKNCPANVDPSQWLLLCAKFASEEFQKKSGKDKENRSKSKTPPIVGSVSIARKIAMNRQKGGQEPSAIDLYEWSHYSKEKNGIVNDHAEKILKDLRAEEATGSYTPAEICVKKLGGILGHLKGRAVQTKQILVAEAFQRELEAEQQRRKEVEERNARMEAQLSSQAAELQVMKDQMAFLMSRMNDSSSRLHESSSE